ncbi:hypothetical protein BY996DRAFT_6607433 [Phakopsora pachyrhizi]|nr:hypothetical protein BY996DRAFT_6607433 [Phakopsora pachyrhizi]
MRLETTNRQNLTFRKMQREAEIYEMLKKKSSEVDLASNEMYPLIKQVKPKEALVLVELGLMIGNPAGIGAILMSLPTIKKVNRESETVAQPA